MTSFIAVLDSLSTYALVYIGITGRAFWTSTRETRAFVMNADSEEGDDEQAPGRRRRRGRGPRISDCKLSVKWEP